jgi:hypothetical protein
MKSGANERLTPLGRKRMQNIGMKIIHASYEYQYEKAERGQKKNALPKVVVCKPGEINLHNPPQTCGLMQKRIQDNLTKSTQRDVRKETTDKQRSGNRSNNTRMIVSEFDGQTRFEGGRMILQGGLPELGKNRLH